jgi:hypothetical protein
VKTFASAMTLQVNDVLVQHKLNAYVVAYVKDEGNNFSTMTFILTSIVSCEILGLSTPFVDKVSLGLCHIQMLLACYRYFQIL